MTFTDMAFGHVRFVLPENNPAHTAVSIPHNDLRTKCKSYICFHEKTDIV